MRVVSLFSGAGGLDLGFKMAGHEIVWANDLYGDAVETYKKNIGDHIVLEDISKISTDDIPACDIVIGGFPCQGFSVANTKRHEDDERNALYKQLLRVIAAKKPKFFVAENVKGLLSLAKGKIAELIISDMTALGYKVKISVLNAADYGVPQRRQRVIIVGVRNDIDFEYIYPIPTHSEDGANGLKKWVSVKEALSKIPDPDTDNSLPNHTYSKYKLEFNGYLGHRKLDPDKPMRQQSQLAEIIEAELLFFLTRMLNAECHAENGDNPKSFPLDYEFYGNNSSVYRQIGNAVPPLLGYAVAKEFNKYGGEK